MLQISAASGRKDTEKGKKVMSGVRVQGRGFSSGGQQEAAVGGAGGAGGVEGAGGAGGAREISRV